MPLPDEVALLLIGIWAGFLMRGFFMRFFTRELQRSVKLVNSIRGHGSQQAPQALDQPAQPQQPQGQPPRGVPPADLNNQGVRKRVKQRKRKVRRRWIE